MRSVGRSAVLTPSIAACFVFWLAAGCSGGSSPQPQQGRGGTGSGGAIGTGGAGSGAIAGTTGVPDGGVVSSTGGVLGTGVGGSSGAGGILGTADGGPARATGGVLGTGVGGSTSAAGGSLGSGGTSAVINDGAYAAVSVQTDSGFETTVTTPAGEKYQVSWKLSQDGLIFAITLPSGEIDGPVALGPVVTDAAGTATGALYMVRGLAGAASKGAPSAQPSASPAPSTGLKSLYGGTYTGPSPAGLNNHAGCDSPMDSFSCSNRGVCCDWHDECITRNCGGGRGSGSVADFLGELPKVAGGLIGAGVVSVACVAGGYASVGALSNCQACHCGAINCFASSPVLDLITLATFGTVVPGKANCCERKDTCGKLQKCMIDGVSIIDPSVCADAGIPIEADAGAPDAARPADAEASQDDATPADVPSPDAREVSQDDATPADVPSPDAEDVAQDDANPDDAANPEDAASCPPRMVWDSTSQQCWALYLGTLNYCDKQCRECTAATCPSNPFCIGPFCVSSPGVLGASDTAVDYWPPGSNPTRSTRNPDGTFTLTDILSPTDELLLTGTVDEETLSGTISGGGTVGEDTVEHSGSFSGTRIDAVPTGGVSSSGGSPGAGGATGTGGAAGSGGTTTIIVDDPCSNVQPCGGDVVGTWTATSSCLKVSGQVDMSAFGLGCTSAPVTGSMQVTGTWAARSDGTYSDNTTTTGSQVVTVPASCLTMAGISIPCSLFGTVLGAAGYSAVSCASATDGGCTCSATVNQTGGLGVPSSSPSTSGTYQTAGRVLTLDGSPRYDYCASGLQLALTPNTTNPTTTGRVVFQKQ